VSASLIICEYLGWSAGFFALADAAFFVLAAFAGVALAGAAGAGATAAAESDIILWIKLIIISEKKLLNSVSNVETRFL